MQVFGQVRRGLQRAGLAARAVGVGRVAIVGEEAALAPGASQRVDDAPADLGRPVHQLGQLTVVDGWPGVVVQDPRPDPVTQEGAQLVAHRGERVQQFPVAFVDQRPCRGDDGAESSRRHLDPEARRHDLLELVRLVEDDDVVLGQHHSAAGQVGAVEVRVHDHDVGGRRTVAGGLGEAASSRGAVEGAGALPGADAYHVPGPVGGLEAEVGPVPAGRRLRPGHQAAHLVDQALGWRRGGVGSLRVRTRTRTRLGFVRPPRSRVTQLGLDPARADLGHPLAAEVVAPPLQDGEVQRDGQTQSRLDEREVLLGQLVLQRLGGGGHDDLPAAEGGGDEIGQRLARPRAGLDDEMRPGDQRLGHGTAHLLLLGAVLPAGHLRRDLVQAVDGVVAGLTGILS